ncbi:hypothetical protein SUGI_0092320 [Cryptomeria japonica]|nr:hypothetical protein SUGI_0092320 [Cryptomeria japonica]
MNVHLIGMIVITTTACHYKPLLIVICVSWMFLQGWPGSINDARLLRNSAFYRLCEGGERLNGMSVSIGSSSIREYIVGDGGYPLLPWLITPFSGAATDDKKSFNFKLSSTRIVVERAFGKLKEDDNDPSYLDEHENNIPNNEAIPRDSIAGLARMALMEFVNGNDYDAHPNN